MVLIHHSPLFENCVLPLLTSYQDSHLFLCCQSVNQPFLNRKSLNKYKKTPSFLHSQLEQAYKYACTYKNQQFPKHLSTDKPVSILKANKNWEMSLISATVRFLNECWKPLHFAIYLPAFIFAALPSGHNI